MRHTPTDSGFSFAELMIVVVVIGVLVAMAVPIYASASAQTERKTCLQNQRVLEGAAQTWLSSADGRTIAEVEGVVTADNPVVRDNIVAQPPSCPSAPRPVDNQHPTVAEGAYTFDSSGQVAPCTFGKLGEHGSFSD